MTRGGRLKQVRLLVVRAAGAADRFVRRRAGNALRPSKWALVMDGALAVGLSVATWYAAANPVIPDDERLWPAPLPGAGGGPIPPVPAPPSAHIPPDDGAGLWAPGDAPILLLALAALCVLPVAARRKYPLGSFTAVLALTIAFHARYDTGTSPDETAVFTFAAVILTAYSAIRHSRYRNAALVTVALGAAVLAATYQTNVPEIEPSYVPIFIGLGVALAISTMNGWRQRLRDAQAEHRADIDRILRNERSRIARDLHDVVTHHVSVMVVQAGAARVALADEPNQVREMLHGIEISGRSAMAELRDMVGLIRDSDGPIRHRRGTDTADSHHRSLRAVDGPEMAPQPGLAQLNVLVDRINGIGTSVEIACVGDPVPLPAGIELAAYRVVQEGLTNSLKHAAGAHISVTLRYCPADLRVDVVDSGGRRHVDADSGSGRGLVGLRERLAIYDGTLDACPRPAGGFALRATIPLGPKHHRTTRPGPGPSESGRKEST